MKSQTFLDVTNPISFLERSSRKKFFQLLLNNHEFYFIIFWMHYTLFIIIFIRYKVNCYQWMNFEKLDFLRLIRVFFRYGLILLRYPSIDSILILPILNIFVSPRITFSHLFLIIFFIMLKTVSNISKDSVFDCFIFFFQF